MTSEQIEMSAPDTGGWLREVAYQLAVMNERRYQELRDRGRGSTIVDPPAEKFPSVHKESDGRWGVWFGPGPPVRSFADPIEAYAFLDGALWASKRRGRPLNREL